MQCSCEFPLPKEGNKKYQTTIMITELLSSRPQRLL